ncbi:MAG: 30S ribosomal protein S20 [Alphaproteobacteria bacterium]|jgi:small subunit ribosomal protein S20|nr:30S ribosomal protein S20 [Thalassospira sp.]MCE2965391.1 30S ribosomal protein S20 [Alphaproteobacteria bacterium]
MAQHESARKRIRVTEKRTAVNRARLSRIRTFVRKVEQAIEAGEAQVAVQALQEAQPEIQRGVSRGVIHRNAASRKISRLAKGIKKLAA